MGKLMRLAAHGIAYFCLATVLAQSAAMAVLWQKGFFEQDRVYRALAGLHRIELPKPQVKTDDGAPDNEQPGLDEAIRRRTLHSLDLSLRESALDKGLAELQAVLVDLKTQRERYNEIKDSFDTKLAALQNIAKDEALQEVQRTLETMNAKQAKDQVLRMLEAGAMEQVVSIVKAMPLEKRKKILAEFKSEEDNEKLFTILTEIRSGTGEAKLIESTRKEVGSEK